jgi:hypothetical protein
MSRTRTNARPLLATLVGTTALALTLAGCSAGAGGSGGSSPAPSRTSSPASTPAPTATSALGITCDELLPSSVLDTLAPGFALLPDSTPASGSNAAQIVSYGGISCDWSDASGATVTLAVAKPTADQLSTAETAIGGSGTRSTLFGADVTAWTPTGGGTFPGDFEVFPEAGYWISTVSSLYTGPDSTQAQTVVAQVLQALPSG